MSIPGMLAAAGMVEVPAADEFEATTMTRRPAVQRATPVRMWFRRFEIIFNNAISSVGR
jgi:hypothetical protein